MRYSTLYDHHFSNLGDTGTLAPRRRRRRRRPSVASQTSLSSTRDRGVRIRYAKVVRRRSSSISVESVMSVPFSAGLAAKWLLRLFLSYASQTFPIRWLVVGKRHSEDCARSYFGSRRVACLSVVFFCFVFDSRRCE